MVKLILRTSWVFALLAIVSMTACNKENDLTTEETVDDFVDQALFTLQQEGNLGRHGCYELVFSITVTFPDGTSASADDYEELGTLIRTWREANPDATERPEFVYPLEVISEDGEVISVASRDELHELRESCEGDYFHRRGPRGHRGQCAPCFHIVFPINILFPDGTTEPVDNRMELKMVVREWKMNNPDATERPTIEFPINVEMEDGTIVPVNSKEELKALREGCD